MRSTVSRWQWLCRVAVEVVVAMVRDDGGGSRTNLGFNPFWSRSRGEERRDEVLPLSNLNFDILT